MSGLAAHPRGPAPLAGSMLSLLRSARRLSPLEPHRSLAIAVSLQPRDSRGLQRFLQDVYDPRSSLYHRFLTPEEFSARFGASPRVRRRVTAWLGAKGLHVVNTFRNGMAILARGDVRHVEAAFSTRLYRYRLGSRSFFANAAQAYVPGALASQIAAVSGLTSAVTERSAGIRVSAPVRDSPIGYTPQDLVRFYDVEPLRQQGQDGSGQTIAVIAHSDFSDADIETYDRQFGLSDSIERARVSDGTHTGVGLTDDENEVEMDLEIVHGLAPGAHIVAYEGSNSSEGAIALYNQIVSDRKAQVVTTSFGDYEQDLTADEINALDTALQEAAAQGQAVFAASGDAGAYDEAGTPNGDPTVLAVDFPASDPWVTGVGGTMLEPSADGLYGSETAWSDSSDPNEPVGSGGGLSRVFKRPDYQGGPGVDNQYSNAMRQVPDVAAMADSPSAGYAIYTVHHSVAGWVQAGGTSASAPLWAGYAAILNQHVGHPIGFFNPTLYAIGRQAGQLAQQPFHDITAGTNLYYPATPGWDYSTGWGSFDGLSLANAAAGYLALTPTATATATPTATPTPRPTATQPPTKSITLRARLSRLSIRRGGQESITVQTVSNAVVSVRVQYPGHTLLDLRGKSDAHGRWSRTWTVRAAHAGQASLSVLVTRGGATRRSTLHFSIT